MGIDGLWEHLPPSYEKTSLYEIAIQRGFNVNRDGQRTYILGIDTSMWLFHMRTVSGTGQNPELLVFFYRCCRLLSAPIRPLFVFDGPGRPKIKRNKERRTCEYSQLNGMREMIHAFGFECLTAPGEAEAALAQLNALGVIDAVLSDDSDCFLFGAKTVIRNSRLGSSKFMEHVTIYDAKTLEDAGFSQEELILIGLLRGGDYDPGIDGCGIKTAINLRRLGFGQALIRHWHTCQDSVEQWNRFICKWRTDIRQELLTNSSNAAQANQKAANNITGSFPNSKVLSLYANPIVFSAEEVDYISKNLWTTELQLSKLGPACAKYFQWGTETAILEKFKRLVWPGAMMQVLLKITRTVDPKFTTILPLPIEVVRKRKHDELNRDTGDTLIRFSTAAFMAETMSGIQDTFPIYSDTIMVPVKSHAIVENSLTVCPINGKAFSTMRIHHSIISTLYPCVSVCESSKTTVVMPRQLETDIISISSGSDEEDNSTYRPKHKYSSREIEIINVGSDIDN